MIWIDDTQPPNELFVPSSIAEAINFCMGRHNYIIFKKEKKKKTN